MAVTFLVPSGRSMRPAAGLPGAALNGLPGLALNGLGDDGGDPLTILDHDLVPFRGSPRFLRLVDTLNRAADYAAGGFHVCVSRGLSGGCKDPLSIHASGTKQAVCKLALNRPDSRLAWAKAAIAYRNAFFMTTNIGPTGQQSLADVKGALQGANILADAAFGLEGIAPPRDPGPVKPGDPPRTGEAAVAYQDKFSTGQKVAAASAFGLAAFGLVGLFSAWSKKKRGGGSYM